MCPASTPRSSGISAGIGAGIGAALAAVLLVGSTACSALGGAEEQAQTTGATDPTEVVTVDPAAGSLAGPKVAEAVTEQLTRTVGQAPDRVSCPDDLPAVVGASIRCELLAGTDTLGVTVTTSVVQEGRVEFDIRVDDAS